MIILVMVAKVNIRKNKKRDGITSVLADHFWQVDVTAPSEYCWHLMKMISEWISIRQTSLYRMQQCTRRFLMVLPLLKKGEFPKGSAFVMPTRIFG